MCALVCDSEDAPCVFSNERPFLPPCSRAISSSHTLCFLSFAIYLFSILTYDRTLGVFFLCPSLNNTLHRTTPHTHSLITQHNDDVVTCLVFTGSSTNTQHTVSDYKIDTPQLSTIYQTLKPQTSPTSHPLRPQNPPLATKTLSTSRHGLYPYRDVLSRSLHRSHEIPKPPTGP